MRLAVLRTATSLIACAYGGACGNSKPAELSTLLPRVELRSPAAVAGELPQPLVEAWRLAPHEVAADRPAATRIGDTRRAATLFRLPMTADATIPASAMEIRLWTSPPTATTPIPAGCVVELGATWPRSERVQLTIAAVSTSASGKWVEAHLAGRPHPTASTLSVSARPSRECGNAQLWMAVSEAQVSGAATPVHRPNLLFVVVDTLRRDAFDCSAEGAAVAPNATSRWCPRGVYFTDAVSTTSWTYPALASMLTGLRPREHGAMHLHDTYSDLRAQVVTLPEILRWNGFETFGIIANPYAARGLWRGFDSFQELFPGPGRMTYESRRAEHVIDGAIARLAEPHRAPFFMFLLLVDAHDPVDASQKAAGLPAECAGVTPPPFSWEGLKQPSSPPSPDEVKRMLCRRSLYREAWRYIDHELGRLMDALTATGHDADTAIILASDHGEEFWEHAAQERPGPHENKPRWGVDHGHTLYGELVRVPLLLIPPVGQGTPATHAASGLVSIADLFATALGLVGVTPPSSTRSLDLSPILAGGAAPHHESVISETTLYGPDRLAVTDLSSRAIYTAPDSLEVFDRAADAAELRPLPLASPAGRRGAAAVRAALMAPTGYSAPSASDLEVLKALGYVR